MIIGLVVAVLKLTKYKWLKKIMDVYITIVRGTPLLLQLYFIFYGLPSLGVMIDSFPSAIIAWPCITAPTSAKSSGVPSNPSTMASGKLPGRWV